MSRSTYAKALPTGMKQTDLGLIPQDWDVKTFGQLFDFLPTANNSRADLLEQGSINYVHYGDIHTQWNHFLDFEENEIPFIDSNKIRNAIFLRNGDLIIADASEDYEGIAKAVEVKNLGTRKAIAGLHTFLLRAKNDGVLIDGYKGYIQSMKNVKFAIDRIATGLKVYGISKNNLKNISIPIPQPEEQQAIAEALSDVDGLIAGLQRLIAKKRDIKTATMQRLLTARVRLPGFSGEWKIKNMAHDSYLKARIGWQGLTTTEYLKVGNYHLVTGTDFQNGRVTWETCHFVEKDRYDQDRNIQLKIGDVLLTKDGTIGKAAYVDRLPGPSTLNSGVFVIRPMNDSYDPKYFFYVLRSRIFEEFLNKLQAGSTINHLYQKDFVNFSFKAPSKREQTAIAGVLSDMDAEIEALKERLDKIRALKAGMMQELLSGRTRIISTKQKKKAAA